MPFGPWEAPHRFLGCLPRGGLGAQPLGTALGPGRLCRWGSQGVAEVPTESPPLTGLSPSLLHSEGSNLTPAHHFQDFRFKTYAPVAFRYFRELFGIRPDDYLVRAVVSHLPARDKLGETVSAASWFLWVRNSGATQPGSLLSVAVEGVLGPEPQRDPPGGRGLRACPAGLFL